MTDLRKAAEMALEALEIATTYLPVKTATLNEVEKAMQALRQALAQTEQETFTLDRGCYERGCVAYDERDGDGVTINVDANSGKFDSIVKRDSSSWVKEKNSA